MNGPDVCVFTGRKDQHSKYSVGGSSASWKDLVVDLLRGMGVQLAGRPQCWTMGVRAGTSVKNDCKSVSSPINCFCGDFLNTLINMIWSNSCWRGFLFSHVLQWWIFALNKVVIMMQSLWKFRPQMAPKSGQLTVWWCTLLVFNKQEIQRRDANPLRFFCFVF